MDDIFINEENNEYDLILPFEFTLKNEIQKHKKDSNFNEDKNNGMSILSLSFYIICLFVFF